MHRRSRVPPAWIALAFALVACADREPAMPPSDASLDEPASTHDAPPDVARADVGFVDIGREGGPDAEGGDERREPAVCDRDAGAIPFDAASFRGCLRCADGSPYVRMSPPIFMAHYLCSATAHSELVRIRTCAQTLDNPVVADGEIAYCAVIDISTDVLAALADGSELTLDGITNFVFRDPSDSEVSPDDLDYSAAPALSLVRRVWMEKRCFCSADSVSATQTLTGRLTIDRNSGERLAGRIKLVASGVIAPTTHQQEKVDLNIAFDVPIAAPAQR